MATQAHCAYCFESLNSYYSKATALTLAQVEELWDEYHKGLVYTAAQDGESTLKPNPIQRLIDSAQSASSSSSSLPSLKSDTSSSATESSAATPEPAETALSKAPRSKLTGAYPLFVTWNTHSRSGHKSLRGCIGTFEALDLERGLSSYALTSALEDVRFSPIPKSQLPQLSNHVTLLTNFSQPTTDPLDWTLGLHGIRISFTSQGRRHGATYLPDVAPEQGWTKEETMISLMRKGGWNGSTGSWQKVWREGRGELIRYEGKQVGLDYAAWRRWRDWASKRMTV